jgi:hypothetical protein
MADGGLAEISLRRLCRLDLRAAGRVGNDKLQSKCLRRFATSLAARAQKTAADGLLSSALNE